MQRALKGRLKRGTMVQPPLQGSRVLSPLPRALSWAPMMRVFGPLDTVSPIPR